MIENLRCEIIDDNLIELLINTLKQHKSLEKFICSNEKIISIYFLNFTLF